MRVRYVAEVKTDHQMVRVARCAGLPACRTLLLRNPVKPAEMIAWGVLPRGEPTTPQVRWMHSGPNVLGGCKHVGNPSACSSVVEPT